MTKLYKIPTLFFALAFAVACNKSDTSMVESNPVQSQNEAYASSISQKNGHYQIDTLLILGNRNKKFLLNQLKNQSLAEKKTVQEIPVFIKAFLDSMAATRDFKMANANEEWQPGNLPVYTFKEMKVKPESGKSLDSVFITMLVPKNVPRQQLVYFGIGSNMAILAHYYGGAKKMEQITMIKFDGEKIVDFWFDNDCSFATSKASILKYLDSPKLPKVRSMGC